MQKLRRLSKTIVLLVVFVMFVTGAGLAAPLHKTAHASVDAYFYYYDNLPGSTYHETYFYTMDYSITVRNNTYINAGYRFIGWNTLANGSGRMYQPGSTYYLSPSTLHADIFLYAQWAKTVSASYNANGSGATGSVSDPTEYIAGEVVTLPDNGFTRSGYRFTGWNTSANGSGTRVMAGADYTVTDTDTENGLTFYAQWESETAAGAVDIPATGDTSNWVLFLVIALANAGALLTILVIRKRQRM